MSWMNIVGDKQANEQALVAGPPTSLSSSLELCRSAKCSSFAPAALCSQRIRMQFLTVTWIDKPPPCAAAWRKLLCIRNWLQFLSAQGVGVQVPPKANVIRAGEKWPSACEGQWLSLGSGKVWKGEADRLFELRERFRPGAQDSRVDMVLCSRIVSLKVDAGSECKHRAGAKPFFQSFFRRILRSSCSLKVRLGIKSI